MQNRQILIRFGIAFCSLFILFLWLNQFQIVKESYSLISYFGFYTKAILYAGTFCLGIFSLVLLLCSDKISRTVAISLAALASTVELLYFIASTTLYDVNDVAITLSAEEHIGPLLRSSAMMWLPTIALFTLLFYSIGRWVNNHSHRLSTLLGWLGIIVSIGISGMMIHNTNGNRQAFSSPIKFPVLLWYAQSNALYDGPRQIVDDELRSSDRPKHIIVIVDESVRGDYLGINNRNLSTTPFLDNLDMTNLGVGYSAGICSDYSNIIMMTGVQMDALPDSEQRTRKRPTLFQYAQKAGYKTAFIDAQSNSNRPDGFMTNDDFNYIDQYKQVLREYPDSKAHERDLNGLKILAKLYQEDTPTFTYFIKFGCHFPYEESYPNAYQKRQPIASIQSWDFEEKPAVINNYKNAVEWSVDHFFEVLTTDISLDNTVVFYTSDHGQNVMDEEGLYLTHCLKSEAPESMAKVPFFVLDKKKWLPGLLMTRPPSHFELFGSITELMGYENRSRSSLSRQSESLYFSSGDIFGRTKMYKNWVK